MTTPEDGYIINAQVDPVFPNLFSCLDFEPREVWNDNYGFGDIALVSLLSLVKLTSGLIRGDRP